MNSLRLFLVGLIVNMLPDTRCFGFKRALYKFAGVEVGANVRICSSAKIIGNGKLIIGNNTWIGHDTLIISTSSIVIGDNVDIAPRVYIGTGTHEIDLTTPGIAGKGINKDVLIGSGCWIGVGSSILPGTILGDKTIVAAGAIVNKSFESHVIIAGVPGSVLKSLKNVSFENH